MTSLHAELSGRLFLAYGCGDPASNDVMRIESNNTQGFPTPPPLMLLHFLVV